MEEVFPHALCKPASAGQTESGVWLDLRTLFAGTRGRSRQPPGCPASHPCQLKAQIKCSSTQRQGEAQEGPYAGGEGGEHGNQTLQDVALQILWVRLNASALFSELGNPADEAGHISNTGSTLSQRIRSVSGSGVSLLVLIVDSWAFSVLNVVIRS